MPPTKKASFVEILRAFSHLRGPHGPTEPLRKLKSLRLTSAYAESPRNVAAVAPIAVITIWRPLGNDRFALTMGPSVKPSMMPQRLNATRRE